VGWQDPDVRPPIPRLLLATAVALAVLAGCSGGSEGDEAPPTTTTIPEATVTTLTPDEAFDQSLTDQLDGLDATFIGGSRAAGRTLCGNLTAATTAGDEEDPISQLTPGVLIGTMFDGFSQPEVAAVVLRAAAESYCPEHAAAIEEVLAERGQ
jgi:hypothetical protein